MTKEELIKLFEDENEGILRPQETPEEAQDRWENWLIERLAKKDAEIEEEVIQSALLSGAVATLQAEIEAWQSKSNRQKRELVKVRLELQSLRSKMDKAQTRTMHKDKYGNLSVYVGHDLEGSETVEVLLMEVEESNE